MSREKLIRVACLNIVCNPHDSKNIYVRLFQTAKKSRVAVNYWGSKYGMISKFGKMRNHENMYSGRLNLYTDFDVNANWLNLKSGETATEDERNAIKIPVDYKPEYAPVDFVFDNSCHRLFFTTTDMGVSSARKLLQLILDSEFVTKNDEEVTVTVQQSKAKLDEFLETPRMQTFSVVLTLPNPDDFEGFEAEFFETLERKNGNKKLISIEAGKADFLQPDSEIRNLGKLAISNGHAEIKYKDDNEVTSVKSTVEFPWKQSYRYDTNLIAQDVAILRVIEALQDRWDT